MNPWELAKKHEALLHTIYEDGKLRPEVLEEIRKTLKEDCIGQPADMIWPVMEAIRDDKLHGPDYVKEAARRIVGPTQELGALANSVHGLISINFAVKALERGDTAEAKHRLKESQDMQRNLTPKKAAIAAALGAVFNWAKDYHYEILANGKPVFGMEVRSKLEPANE